MNKYESLVNILDRLRYEAPLEFKRYRPSDSSEEALNQARSRTLIHLYLKVNFGILDFKSRERLITDKSHDAGIDAYYIDTENKRVILLQAKFRTSRENFENKNISFDELLKMEVSRVIDGESNDEEGQEYNGKIKQLQREISELPDVGRYKYEVVILANVKALKLSQLTRLTGGFPAEIFDNERVYKELVFPVVTGTFYNSAELSISLNLVNKSTSAARISYSVETEYEDCDITVVFVPTEEIGRILHTYQNSILKYNPRCYLEMKTSSVNKGIYDTIKTKKTNEFALFNNGLTMLSDDTAFNERIGQKDRAQIIINNPQLINGGQTSYTLSRIFSECLDNTECSSVFQGKEVLLKIVTFGESTSGNESNKRKLIEDISKATNRQSVVSDADRRSNDKVQVDLQEILFDEFGCYYERKKGEFSNGIREKYISRKQIVDRDTILRVAVCLHLQPSITRTSINKLYTDENFSKYMPNASRSSELYYGYLVLEGVRDMLKKTNQDSNDRHGISSYGYALRYGHYSLVTVCIAKYFEDKNSIHHVSEHLREVLGVWAKFEETIMKKTRNSAYFRYYEDPETLEKRSEVNFEGYYKGKTLNSDLIEYFKLNKTF
ncbi:AIPR family protein [Aliidiomarina maris]|uniref:AIPR protein n=1 Tax=Aliidiomarina maris TaxID=531312 RepID=A0A327WZG0_9GAMM|nr:AIPR family protein [Aliidiomarina maris]RAJ99005.1 AIPR protein [Aliidiomarina maris]RUO25140.1 AIPR protein [Aliidiomarina maris]